MKVSRNVDAVGTSEQIAKLVELLQEAHAAGDWRPAPEMAERVGRSSPGRKPLVFEFKSGDQPRALVWLFPEATRARITNIVPLTPGRIEPDEYNAIAAQFIRDQLQPACNISGCRIALGPEERTAQTELSPTAFAALKLFSLGANKSTGNSHSDDARRWYDFVIQCHRDRSKVNHEVFVEWMQTEGWEDETISELYDDYEMGLELLRHYDDTRA